MTKPVARLDWIAKAGFVARGLVYVLFGTIALTARAKTEDGQRAVFDTLHDLPLGGVLLVAMALGLVAYGVFRLACGVLDIEGKGSKPKGLAGRAAQVGSGLFHLAIAWTAVQFIDGGSSSGGNRNSHHKLLRAPAGSPTPYLASPCIPPVEMRRFRALRLSQRGVGVDRERRDPLRHRRGIFQHSVRAGQGPTG